MREQYSGIVNRKNMHEWISINSFRESIAWRVYIISKKQVTSHSSNIVKQTMRQTVDERKTDKQAWEFALITLAR